MTPRKLLAALLATLAIAGPASATLLTSVSGAPGATVTDYSGASLASFDMDLHGFSSTRLEFMVEQDDLLSPFLNLNAIVRNLSGAALQRFTFKLDGIAFAGQGSVTPTFGTVGNVDYASNGAAIGFASPEWAEFHFGNPFAIGGKSDWQLNLGALQAGDRFAITAMIAEPATWLLMLAGMAMFGLTVRGTKP